MVNLWIFINFCLINSNDDIHSIESKTSNFSFEGIRIEERKQLCDCVPYYISYFLEDDTISVKERKHRDESYDICPFLIKRIKVPRYAKRLINSLIFSEDESVNDQNTCTEYLQPSDFMVGSELNLLGHRFLIRDCDSRTRNYYEEILKKQQGERVTVDKMRPIQRQHVSSFRNILDMSSLNTISQNFVVKCILIYRNIDRLCQNTLDLVHLKTRWHLAKA